MSLGIIEKHRGAGLQATGKAAEVVVDDSGAQQISDEEAAALKRPRLFWFNLILTIAVIAMLCFSKIELYAAFMIGLSLALVVNFPSTKLQGARIKAHAPEALGVPMILLASGVFLGVLTGTKMMDAMANCHAACSDDLSLHRAGRYFHQGAYSLLHAMALGSFLVFVVFGNLSGRRDNLGIREL